MKSRPKKSRTHPALESTEAQLYVGDVEKSCEFYVAKLGFAIAFAYGEPPFYAQVRRDGARLNVRLVREPVFVGDIRQREHLLSASITVTTSAAIEILFREFQASAVQFMQTLKQEPWGAQTFTIIDPDGNLVLFAAPAA